MASPETRRKFLDMKFGMFIHWGLYALPGGRLGGRVMPEVGEWFQSWARMPNTEYAKYASVFNPVHFNADEWVRKAAEAGMKYIVFTSKHHDGFSMYRTKVSPFNIVDASPFGRDPLSELSDACRKYGLTLGIYYSHHLDWHEKDGGDPGPEWNHFAPWGNNWDFPDLEKKNFRNYFHKKVIPQVMELLSNYGPVGVIWFDCALNIPSDCSEELFRLVRRLQPECMINSRIGNGFGDYGSLGDNQLLSGKSADLAAESPGTLNDTWGFKYDDHNWKTPEYVIEVLLSLAEKNANYLLNVGPMPDGKFTPETDRILSSVGAWTRMHGAGLFGASGSSFPQTLDFAFSTTRGNTLYFFLKEPLRRVRIHGIRNKVLRSSVPFEREGETLVLFPPDFGDELFPAIAVELDGKPVINPELCEQNGSVRTSAVNGTVSRSKADSMIVEKDASLAKWSDPADSISWKIHFPESGVFRAEVRTKRRWKKQWNGEGVCVELSLDGEKISSFLKSEKNEFRSSCAMAESEIGVFTVSEPGTRVLSLRTVSCRDAEAAELRFQNVVLTRI